MKVYTVLFAITTILLVITVIFALASDMTWFFTGPPETQENFGGFGPERTINNGTTDATVYKIRLNYIFSNNKNPAIIYQPNSVKLANFSVESSGLPVLDPFYNLSIINITVWVMTYIFTFKNNLYSLVSEVNQSASLNSTNLVKTGSLIWKPQITHPITHLQENKYFVGIYFFENEYVQNLTSKSFTYQYWSSSIIGVNPTSPPVETPFPANNPTIVSTIDPSAGAIVIYRSWYSSLDNLIVILGLSLSGILFIATGIIFVLKRKKSP